MFKFSQKEVTAKDFYRQTQITDLFTIDISKVVVSDKVPCNNGKDCCYIVGYQVDEALIPLSIKTSKNIFSYGVSQHDKNSAYAMSFNVFEAREWVLQCNKIWNEVELQLFEKLATGQIKGEGRYRKVKIWRKHIKANFHGQNLPCNMYCNATVVLKIDSVYKKAKIIIPRYMLKRVNTPIQETDNDNDDGFFEV